MFWWVLAAVAVVGGTYWAVVPPARRCFPGLPEDKRIGGAPRSTERGPQAALATVEANLTDELGGGAYAILPQGRCKYYLLGAPHLPKLVYIHGITLPAEATAMFLLKISERYRVLAYDLYGRGHSDAPGVDYDEAFYVNQLLGLLVHVGWLNGGDRAERLLLVGNSLGGAIATLFALRFPTYVQGLMLAAPAGLLRTLPLTGRLACIPILGDLLVHTVGAHLLGKASRANYRRVSAADKRAAMEGEAVVTYQISQHRGFMRSYLSTIRHFSLRGFEPLYQQLGELVDSHDIRVLVVGGTSDKVAPFTEDLRLYIPSATVVMIPEAGHHLFSEHGTAVVRAMHEAFSPRAEKRDGPRRRSPNRG